MLSWEEVCLATWGVDRLMNKLHRLLPAASQPTSLGLSLSTTPTPLPCLCTCHLYLFSIPPFCHCTLFSSLAYTLFPFSLLLLSSQSHIVYYMQRKGFCPASAWRGFSSNFAGLPLPLPLNLCFLSLHAVL
jgi:hypothetical protein